MDESVSRTQRSPEAQDYHKWYKRKVWLKLRESQLSKQPLCERHLKLGDYVLANVVNHKDPHRGDWLKFVNGQLESVCKHCHDSEIHSEEMLGYSKRIGVDGFPADPRHPFHTGIRPKRWGYSIPRGVEQSRIPVMLICGPPASGKTTYVQQNKYFNDLVIDLDDCKVAVGGKPWDLDWQVLRRAFARRDALIRGLRNRSYGTAWLIVSAPTRTERNRWAEALGNVVPVILNVPLEVCWSRIDSDPLRAHASTQLKAAVRSWWKRHTP